MSIFLNKDSRIIVQGMTGSEGMKHTRRMLASGSNIVGGVNPRKAGERVDIEGREIPVFGSARGYAGDRRQRHRHLRASKVHQECGGGGDPRWH